MYSNGFYVCVATKATRLQVKRVLLLFLSSVLFFSCCCFGVCVCCVSTEHTPLTPHPTHTHKTESHHHHTSSGFKLEIGFRIQLDPRDHHHHQTQNKLPARCHTPHTPTLPTFARLSACCCLLPAAAPCCCWTLDSHFFLPFPSSKFPSNMRFLFATLFSVAAVVLSSASVSLSKAYQHVFNCTRSVQKLTIPRGVSHIDVKLVGGGGGSDSGNNGNGLANGGLAGVLNATIAVVGGGTYYIYVGSKGASLIQPATAAAQGGYNGGGAGSYGHGDGRWSGGAGGGATDIRTDAFSLESRIAVAGGAGGSDGDCYNTGVGGSGAGFGALGAEGGPGANLCEGAGGGGGGTSQKGGNGGSVFGDNSNGGTFGFGGNAGPSGGGGGGGYYGGGAGCGGSGGGGSSFCNATLCSSASYNVHPVAGDGFAIISYSFTPTSTPSAAPTFTTKPTTSAPTFTKRPSTPPPTTSKTNNRPQTSRSRNLRPHSSSLSGAHRATKHGRTNGGVNIDVGVDVNVNIK